MANALKTLYGALQGSAYLTTNNVTLVFGDEETNTQRYAQPYAVMIPKGGPYGDNNGYAANQDPALDRIWENSQQIDFWLYNSSSAVGAQGGIDHADAVESLRQWMLSALRDQEAQYTDVVSVAYGLKTKIISERWETLAQNPSSKFNRALVLSTQIQISVPMATNPSPEATINSVITSTTVIDKPAT